jgi:hypothetical protein
MHNAWYYARMVKHAQRKNKTSTNKQGGVAVGRRYRVDVYFEMQDDVEMVDRAKAIKGMRSRSEFGSHAMLKEARKTILDAR